MGSFPSILRFDSLGQHKKLHKFIILYINLYKLLFFKIFKQKNTKQNNIRLFFIKNNFFIKTHTFKKTPFLFENSFINNVLSVLYNLFFLKINFLVLDNDFNYNYLPVGKFFLKKKNLYKTIKYFDVKVLLFLGLKPRNFKNLSCLNLLNISTTNNNKHMDFFLKISNLKIFQYVVYIFILGIYLNK